MYSATLAVACRYWYELTVGFWVQFSVTQIPHKYPRHFLPLRFEHFTSMHNFVGSDEYMCNCLWADTSTVIAAGWAAFEGTALPNRIDETVSVQPLGAHVEKRAVVPSDQAFGYLMSLADRDLQYRGMRDDILACFR